MRIPRYIYPLSAFGTAVGAFVLFKEKSGGNKYTGDVKLPGRTVIVTGATSGIGKETAKELAKREARVILACRDIVKCNEVRSKIIEDTFNRNVDCIKLDLSSIKSIQDFAETINKNEKRVDILINNAGILEVEDNRSVTVDGFEMHMGVNYLGPFLLTNLLLDKLIASGHSRVINLIGIGYNRVPIGFNDFNLDKKYVAADAYKRSKLALALFTVELAKRLKGTGVTVCGVHPGVVYTSLRKSGGVVARPMMASFSRTPIQGAQTTLYCALDSEVEALSGQMFSDCRRVDTDPIALDEEKSKRLWAISERWTRLTA